MAYSQIGICMQGNEQMYFSNKQYMWEQYVQGTATAK